MLENFDLQLSSVVQLRQLVLLSTREISVQNYSLLHSEALEEIFFIFLTSWLEAKAFIFSYYVILLVRNTGVVGVVVRDHPHSFPELVLQRRSHLFLQEISKGDPGASITDFCIGPYVFSHAQHSLLPLQSYLQRWLAQGIHFVHQRVQSSGRGSALHLEDHWRRLLYCLQHLSPSPFMYYY